MEARHKKHGWLKAGELLQSWQYATGMRAERMAVLSAVWEREFGHMAAHWKLQGVRRGVLYVAARSPAAALELRMQAPVILRGLNKHFQMSWIKSVRATR